MSRGLSSTIGVLFLVGLTVIAAATVGAVVTVEEPTAVPGARLSLAADSESGRIALTHEGGETLQVDQLTLTVTIDGQRLGRQPPVPFFAARGFRAGPTGPFNRASGDRWSAGETGAFRLAATNRPSLSRGAHVEVTVATQAGTVARLETTAR